MKEYLKEMREENLIEIAKKIVKCDGPLGRSIYIKEMLSSLNKEEYTNLQSALKNPKYDKLNILDKYLALANDFLKSKNISISEVMPIYKGEEDIDDIITSYLDNMLVGDKSISNRRR